MGIRALVVSGTLALYVVLACSAVGASVTVGQSGATYTTVLDAWNAVRTQFGSHTITLIDNGPSGTGYTETSLAYTNIVGNQASSINITASAGVSPTIILSGSSALFDIAKNGITLRVTGVSNTDRITLNSSAANPIISFADTVGSSMILQNVNFVKSTSVATAFIDFTCLFFSINQLTNISFSGGSSSSSIPVLTVGSAITTTAGGAAVPLTMTNVDFTAANGNGPRVRLDNITNVNGTNCKFGFASSSTSGAAAVAWNQYSGVGTNAASSATLRGCQFASGSTNLFDPMGSSAQSVRNLFDLYRPVFNGNCGNTLLNIADSKAEVQVLGLDDSNQPTVAKVDLDGLGSLTTTLAAMNSGKLTLKYVSGSTNARTVQYSGTLTANPTITLEACLFSGGVGRLIGTATGGAFGPQVTATNCILNAGANPFVSTADSRTGAGSYTFTHCTLLGTGPALFTPKTGDTISASGSVFDAFATTNGVAPGFALGGGAVPNLYHDPTSGTSFASVPGNTLFAAPQLSASGRPTAASAEILGGATGSATALDIDAVSRPRPTGTTRDIGADEASFPPSDLTPNTLSANDNAANASAIGQLTATDPDDGETLTWTLLDSAGGRFSLAGTTTSGLPMEVRIANTTLLDAADGPQSIQVRVSDSESNLYVETIAITVLDTTPPTLTLNGDSDVTIQCGDAWSDPGATASDNVDGTFAATIGGATVDTSPAGVGNNFVVVYNAADVAGNAATPVQRTVRVVDTLAPIVSINGTLTVNLDCGDSYADAGATASDGCEGALAVTVTGDTVPDPAEPGTYVITYTAADAQANTAQAQRTVVVDLCPLEVTIEPPATASVTEGESHTFQVQVTGASGPVQYQWYFDADDAPPVALTGEETAALSLTSITLGMAGEYYCEVSDASRMENSPSFTLAVTPNVPLGSASAALVSCLVAAGAVHALRRWRG